MEKYVGYIVFILNVLFQGAYGISVYYLDQHCAGTIIARDQIQLKLTSNIYYQPNMDCHVTIESSGPQMMLFYRSLFIERHSNCSFDWVEIRDGDSMAAPLTAGGRKCGSGVKMNVYETNGSYILVAFHSDSSIQRTGFDIVITSYHTGNCSSSEYQCNNGRCISSSLRCSGYNPCGDNSDCDQTTEVPAIESSRPIELSTMPTETNVSYTAVTQSIEPRIVYMDAHCGKIVYVVGQIRLKLTRDSSYQPSFSCQLYLSADSGQNLMVYFRSVDIENEGTCTYDWLEILDGSSMSAAYLNDGKICGSRPPSLVYTTSGQYMTVYFKSDQSQQFSGFDMVVTSYHVGSCYSSEYRCNNDRCISDHITCTGFNPCGDHSDCQSPQTGYTETPFYIPSTYMNTQCGGTLSIDGMVRLQLTRDSTYLPNLSCEVNFRAHSGHRMMIYFRSMGIENEGTCKYDYLELDDGVNRNTPYITGSKLCGSNPPNGVYVTSGRYLTVYFHSDGTQEFSGFDIVLTSYHTGSCSSSEYQCYNDRCISNSLKCARGYNPCGDFSDCGGVTQTPPGPSVYTMDEHCGRSKYISTDEQLRLSLTNGSAYPTNFTCRLTLRTYSFYKLMVYFESIDMSMPSIWGSCEHDYVSLYDVVLPTSSHSMAGGKRCGVTTAATVYYTSGSFMDVYFESNSSSAMSHTGFNLIVTPYTRGYCGTGLYRCNNGRCISDNLRCSGLNPCGDYSDCYSTTTSTVGVSGNTIKYLDNHCGEQINIGRFQQIRLKLTNSSRYQPNFSCKTVFSTISGDYITIQFLSLDTEDICSYDWVEVDDGSSTTSPYLAGGKQCGHYPPSGVYKTSGPYLTVYFHSDSSTQGSGFDMIIKSSVTVYMNDHCSETIDIQDYQQIRLKLTRNDNYRANMNCEVTIKTKYGEQMMLYFRDLDTESACSNDWLEIDDGISRSYPYIAGGKKCGHETPTDVYKTSGRYVTLYFESDFSVQGRGFDMIITSFHPRSGFCYSGEYRCANNRCINESLTCNGYNSCGDYSDCIRSCKSDEFRCDNGRCIPERIRCNARNPCGDYSDCTTTTQIWRTRTTTTESSYDYSSGLSGPGIAGITLGCILFFVLIFAALCCNSRRRGTPQGTQTPNIATVQSFAVARYAYENPIPMTYSEPPPTYAETVGSPAYPGSTGPTAYPETLARDTTATVNLGITGTSTYPGTTNATAYPGTAVLYPGTVTATANSGLNISHPLG